MKTLKLELKDVCLNTSLKGDDEVRLSVNPNATTSQTTYIGIQKIWGSSPNPILSVIGDGYILTDGVSVKEYEVSTNSYQFVTFNLSTMNGNTEIAIKNAHNVLVFNNSNAKGSVFVKDIEDITKFASTMIYLNLYDFDDYLDIDSGILAHFTALQELTLSSPAAFGHLRSIPSSVQRLYISHSNITGDISTLPNNVNTFYTEGSQVYGNLALVPNNFRFVWGTTVFSWPSTTARDVSKKQFGISYAILGNDLDNMLINMAACAVNEDIPSNQKIINVSGNHTADESVWQNAVASLQNSGFTVTIRS